MKRTDEKSSQSITSAKLTTLNLQTRGFTPPQKDVDEEIPKLTPISSSENILARLLSTPTPEASIPIQRKPQNRLKAAYQAKRMSIQAKLNIGEPNDKYEQEADATASKVVQQINSPTQDQSIQRQESMEEEDEELQMKPISKIQRQESMEEKDEELQMKSVLQRRENVGGGEASQDLESSIQSARGSGQSLDSNLQAKMGKAMGADFSGVRVHTDSKSDQLNQSIQAKAFTTGQDVFFRQGEYNPSSKGGQELIAHELTHVMQQQGSQLGNSSEVSRKKEDIQSVQPPILDKKLELSFLTSSQSQQIQRLRFENTNWNESRTFKGSDGGGGGVLFISDQQSSLVVKPNGDVDEELMASHIHGTMREASRNQQGWKISGLRTRFAEDGESENIVDSAQNAANREEFTPRTHKLLGELADSGRRTMIQEAAKGQGYGEILQSTGGKHIKEGNKRNFGKLGKKDKVMQNSGLKPLTKDPTFAVALGRLAASDIFLGNTDRIVFKANLDNMLMNMGQKTINPIDNFDMQGNMGITNKPFDVWRSNQLVSAFIDKNYDFIANEVFGFNGSDYTDVPFAGDILTGWKVDQGLGNPREYNVAQDQREAVKNKLTRHMMSIKQNFATGLEMGRNEILRAGIPADNSGISQQSIELYAERFYCLNPKRKRGAGIFNAVQNPN